MLFAMLAVNNGTQPLKTRDVAVTYCWRVRTRDRWDKIRTRVYRDFTI